MTLTIPTLTTERLTLRAPHAEDFPRYAEIFATDRARHMGGPLGRNAAWREFAADNFGWLVLGFGYWTVVETDAGTLAGFVGLAKPPSYPENELGWMVHTDCEGKGIAHEAALAARHHAYETMGFKTLVSYIDAENRRSVALAKRLGCTLDQTAAKPEDQALVYRHPTPGALQ